MISAVLISLVAGLLGGFALNKLASIKDFHFFNTWFVFLVLVLLISPVLSGFVFVKDLVELLTEIPHRTLKGIAIPSLFGGVGLFLLVNSIRKMPIDIAFAVYFVSFGLGSIVIQSTEANWVEHLPLISLGMLWVFYRIRSVDFKFKSAFLPILAGILSTGFVFASKVEPQMLQELALSFGNDYWQVELLKIVLITVASSVFVLPIFLAQAGQKNAWVYFDTPLLGKNLLKITGLAILVMACVFVYFVLKPYSTATLLPFIGAIIVGLFIKLP